MQGTPKLSVIMPVFNGGKFLRDSMESILGQGFTDFEFIIVDDASTDDTPHILGEYARLDPRIRLLRNTSNRGVVFSLNRAIEKCVGTYVARMDCDDVSAPERFQRQIDFMDGNREVGLLGSAANIINEENKVIGMVTWAAPDAELRKALIKLCPFFHPSVMIRKEVFEAVGNYNQLFRHAEDYELWFRISRRFKLANLSEPLLNYRVLRKGSVGATRHREAKRSAAKAQWTAVRSGLYSPFCLLYALKNILISLLPHGCLDIIAKMYFKRITTYLPNENTSFHL